MIVGVGFMVFCDLCGIWFLLVGKCVNVNGVEEFCFVFEDVVFGINGFEKICDVVVGEVILVDLDGKMYMF